MFDSSITVTTTVFLDRLAESEDAEVWADFDRRYRPIVLALFRRAGLAEDVAADVAQETMLSFLSDFRLGKYERGRGRLRHWLLGIARHRLGDHFERSGRDRRAGGDTILRSVEDPHRMEQIWEEEFQAKVISDALDVLRRASEFRRETIRAFERFALEEVEAEAVAAELGMSVQAVYNAKHQCLSRLRELAEVIADAYASE